MSSNLMSLCFNGYICLGVGTFRHTSNAGYSISEIKSAVNSSMKPLLRSGFPEGVNFKGTVVVDGVKIKYNAWKFNDGTWNIGSIKPPR